MRRVVHSNPHKLWTCGSEPSKRSLPPPHTHPPHTHTPASLLIHSGPGPPPSSLLPPFLPSFLSRDGWWFLDRSLPLSSYASSHGPSERSQPTLMGRSRVCPSSSDAPPSASFHHTSHRHVWGGGLVDVDPTPPPNRGVQKGHDPVRKKERKKNRKPTQQDGGKDGDTTEPPDKPRHVSNDSSSSLSGDDRCIDGKGT